MSFIKAERKAQLAAPQVALSCSAWLAYRRPGFMIMAGRDASGKWVFSQWAIDLLGEVDHPEKYKDVHGLFASYTDIDLKAESMKEALQLLSSRCPIPEPASNFREIQASLQQLSGSEIHNSPYTFHQVVDEF